MNSLFALIAKYPITRLIRPHLDFEVDDTITSSRAAVLLALLSMENPNRELIYTLLNTCNLDELSYVIDKPLVIRWFVECYHNGTRDITDFFESCYDTIDILGGDEYKFIFDYCSAITTPENESEIYDRCAGLCIRVCVEFAAIRCTKRLFREKGINSILDNNTYFIFSLLQAACDVSKERLITVIEWLVSIDEVTLPLAFYAWLYSHYALNAQHDVHDNSGLILTTIQVLSGVTREKMLSLLGADRATVEKALNILLYDEV